MTKNIIVDFTDKNTFVSSNEKVAELTEDGFIIEEVKKNIENEDLYEIILSKQ